MSIKQPTLTVLRAVSFAVTLSVANAMAAELTVMPNEFELGSKRARQRLIVSKWFDEHTHSDVTSEVEFASSDAQVATVNSSGIISPTGNGTTEIVVRYKGSEAQARVVVSSIDQTRRIDFRTEVIAALSRGGCNQGACHGSPQGKNGFRLSLRGFDPSLDIMTLTREVFGRRLNLLEPDHSLVLQKATGKVAHQGGVRFRSDDPALLLLKQWVAEGCQDSDDRRVLAQLELLPTYGRLHTSNNKQQLIVIAHFNDGSAKDVTDLAVFSTENEDAKVSEDGLVEFSRTAEAAILARYLDRIATSRLTYVRFDPDYTFESPLESNYVDRHVFNKQRYLQLRPAEIVDDAVFLRRVYLDLIGGIPTVDQSRGFLESTQPEKRKLLIDELLERKEYAQFWALKWADVMRGSRETISLRGVHNFHRYLEKNFAADRPYNEVACEIVASVGNTINVPAANFYRVSRTPTDAAESLSQLFLGVRIQCAKCHNHPYESITQNDYYGLAAYFARVKIKGTRFGIDDEFVFLSSKGEVKLPGGNTEILPSAFGTKQEGVVDAADRRTMLADWMTAKENRYFARSTVNRIWRHLLGRGLVEPVDDFRDSNPPSNPELLDALAEQFVESGYRFKPVIRTVLNSHTYQLAAFSRHKQSEFAADESKYCTRAEIKMLDAEQVIDAISTATGVPELFPGYPRGTKAIALAEGGVDHKFLRAFTKPVRDVACDCARETEPNMNQVLHLINNSNLLAKVDSKESHLARWLESGKPIDDVISSLYLATLCRHASADEIHLAKSHINAADSTIEGCRDLLHALINSNEFLLRH